MMIPDKKAISRGYTKAKGALGAPGLRRGYKMDDPRAISRGRRRMIMGGAMAGTYAMVAPPNPNSRAGRSSGGTGILNSRSIGGYA